MDVVTTRVRHGLLITATVLLVGGVLAVAVRATDDSVATSPTSTSRPTSSTTPSSTITTPEPTTTRPRVAWPAPLADGVAHAVVTSRGVVLAVRSVAADGRFVAESPCGNQVTVAGAPLSGATVVLDPGHGGDEPGAVGPNGTKEKDINLAVALETKRQLEAEGAVVVLTRTADYRITLASRAAIVQALHPTLFISIHHNAAPDELRSTPGAETYRQIASAGSKRASGLIYEEIVRAFSAHKIQWAADRDAGAKYRLRSNGGDYYGILSRTEGTPGVLSEAAFITNPPEEELLVDPAFRAVEAGAFTRAVIRYVTTDDPGSGFVVPYPRTEPAGPGGGGAGCVDPPLG